MCRVRALGIDFGLKRVGVSVSDRTGTLVSPFKTIERTTRDSLFDELIEIIQNESIEAVVVGLPLSLDGEDTLTTRQARNFAESLGRRITVPIHLMDERLTLGPGRGRTQRRQCSRQETQDGPGQPGSRHYPSLMARNKNNPDFRCHPVFARRTRRRRLPVVQGMAGATVSDNTARNTGT